MKINTTEIKYDNLRVRKETGDLTYLAKSIEKYGLLQPLVIDSSKRLICGYRRLMAVKQLDWQQVDVIIVDPSSKIERLEIEMDENIARKSFTYDEMDMGFSLKDKMTRPSIFKRIFDFIASLFKRKN